MEDTQAISWEVEEEEETERPNESLGHSLEPLGRLHIFSSAHGPEKDFPLYLGKNVVGRMPDCSVALPFPSISKQHAVIEILAWDKAPVLRDCGSLNGTQILRPPKVLSPGMSHRLRDQELVLFADLPCQYHRLNVPLPFVSRGPLTVEETPRVQGRTQPQGLLLAEDSEEEVDSLSERCVVKESRTTSSPVATVIPESDEEGPSLAPDGPGPPFAFNLDSDTDEEENQQPAAGEASSAATRDATAKTEQPKAVVTEIQLEKNQCSVKERNNDTKIESDARNGVVPIGVILERSQPAGEDSETDVDDESRPPGRPVDLHLERTQPSGFIDSDTDLEEEGVPATPAVDPMKKRQILHGVSTNSPGGLDLAHLQETLADSDTDVEKGEASLMVPLERSQASMVIDSNTDDEEEVSAALTLACLKESRAAVWNRDTDVEEDRTQPVAILEQSQTSSGKDSDTDVEEEGFLVEKRESVPKGHADKAHSEKSQPPFGDSDIEVEKDKSSPGVHLERNQASATMGINTQVEEEVPPGPAITLQEKHQMPVVRTNRTNMEAEGGPAKLPVVHLEEAQPPPGGDYETDAEEGVSLAALAVADERKSQLPAEREAECALAVLEQERALEAGAQGGSPVAQVEQDPLPVSQENLTDLVVDTGTPGEPTQPQRKGAQPLTESGREPHMDKTKDSRDNNDDSEDLDLQATQCFVERENQNLEGALDEPWEVLATQPFCPRESEASETQPIAAHLEAHGSCPSPSRAMRRDQHPESPVHAEPLESQGRGMQTVERGMGIPRETAERVTPKRGPLGRETKKLPPEGKREDVMGEEELTRVFQDREQKQVLARATQKQESDKMVKRTSMEKDPKSLKVENETSKELQEKKVVEQTLGREIFERKAEKLAPERESEPGELEVCIPKAILDRGAQKEEIERESQDQKGQASSSTPEPEVGAGNLQGLASALIASRSQSGGERGAPMSPKRQQRGHLNCKIPPAEEPSRGDPESLDAYLPPTVPEASSPLETPLISQSQKHPAPQLLSPFPPSLEPPIAMTRQNGSQEALETPLSSELAPLHAEPKARLWGSSRMTSPVSSLAVEPHLTSSIDHPVSPKPTSWATRIRTRRFSEMTPAPVVPTAPELQSSTSKDQPVTPKPTSRVTRSRTRRSSVKTPAPVVPTGPEFQPSISTDQPITPKPTYRATRGRTHRSSVKTPEPSVPSAPELQLFISTNQPVTPKPTSRGRTHRSSVKTPEPIIPSAPELQHSTSMDQPVSSRPTSRATRGRTHRSSVKTPQSIVLTAPELQSSTSKGQSVTTELISGATWGRAHRSFVKIPEPVVPIVPELQPSTPTDHPVIPKPISQGRTPRSSVKTPESMVPTAPELQPSTKHQPVALEPTSRATRGRTRRSSVKTHQLESTALDLESLNPTDQPVTRKAIAQGAQSRTLRSTTSSVLVSTKLEFQSPTDQPIPPELIPQGNYSGRPRATRKRGSLSVPIIHEPCSAPPEPNSRSSRNQRRGAVKAAESRRTIPAPAFAQIPEAPTHAPQIQKAEEAGRYGFTPEPQPKASQNHKRPLGTADLPPLQKRLQRGEVSQKTAFLKEKEDPAERPGKEEDVVITGPGKRKRDQTEEEPKGMPGRSLRRTKLNESTAPKVLFTGVVDARGERAVLALGGSLASSVAEASHLVTDRIRRTVKFLCALGRGIPILSLDWLHQSRKAGCFLPPDEYVVTDPEQEKNFGFSLRDALSRAQKRRLLEGYEIHVTPGVQPPPLQMGEIISCCGGTVLSSMPRSYKPQRVVITCSQDFPRCSIPFRVGLPILSPEFLLTGVLKQEAKPEAFVLSTLEMSST
ncbi:mediator of DNA damage checkpoint protein 1 isoform X2 [Pteropus alecto]|uniref:Mediator of DNA damage checkpoint protein 1 n=3 Tax=Pteropus alecto TaxID=9402 RepID=L5KHW3_PTEAL|nr:mediator of DNA damage checkpoint protein 1 isoform X2 [Pteropus alecto]XP_015446240.1 mediator of DNA damage checkpoint protein 1 isoform X2 [Pteropus alecto]ELK11180.1 Mediator of DNA damage checkpoint protein 1 [Pteropus alecto]